MADASTRTIPEPWKSAVCRILRKNRAGTIFVRNRARREWEAAFPQSFEYQRNEAIIAALECPGAQGKQITTMSEPGEVWEFFSVFEHQSVYVKINLCPGERIIILYSAHPPFKGDKL